MSSLTELKELADAATPGRWVSKHPPGDAWVGVSITPLQAMRLFGTITPAEAVIAKGLDPDDARYIAACSPEVVRALVAVAGAAEHMAWSLHALMDHPALWEECPDPECAGHRKTLDALKEVLK